MHVAEAGAGEPLLLVHGWPQHWYQWRGVIQRAGRRPPPDRARPARLRLDRRARPARSSPTCSCDDLIALLDALGIERTDLAGHDWGGFTSLLLAARHPERFRKVVALLDPAPVGRRSRPGSALETWRAWYAVLFAAGLAERTPKLAELGLRREGVAPEPYVARLREPARAQATTRLYRSYLRTLRATVRGGTEEPRPRSEVLLCIGEKDQLVSPRLGAGLPNFEVIRGAGHFVCDTHANVVAERIRSFL